MPLLAVLCNHSRPPAVPPVQWVSFGILAGQVVVYRSLFFLTLKLGEARRRY